MVDLTRRGFLRTGLAVAAGATAGRLYADDVPPPPMVELGKTGIRVSRLAMGTGTHGVRRQSDQTRLGFARLVSLFKHAYDRGVRFFDLADQYGSHYYFREALRTIPRERVAILTKLQWRFDGPVYRPMPAYRAEVARSHVERFLLELTTDYIDVLLLHCMVTETWDRDFTPYMDALARLKEEKKVRALGVSCHDFGALRTAAESPWVDVILARFNPYGVKMDGSPEQIHEVLRLAKRNGKAVIGMKIFGEGTLADRREHCMRFAQTSGVLDAMTIGFVAPEQIDDVLRLMAKYPHSVVAG